jgi:hypothetical protein
VKQQASGVRDKTPSVGPLSDFERGVFVGLMVGDASFGGDGRQPQITLRMHVRHEALFRWLLDRFPQTRLYGPYHHGGRSYFQWMARGRSLVRDVLPVLEAGLSPGLDGHAAERLELMRSRYATYIERERALLRVQSDGVG